MLFLYICADLNLIKVVLNCIMKKLLTALSVCFLFFTLLSCSKNESDSSENDSSESEELIATYTGQIVFLEGTNYISNPKGTVKMVKRGDVYDFRFSDGISDLKDISLEQKDGLIKNTDFKDGERVINLMNNQLTVLYTRDSKTWIATTSK